MSLWMFSFVPICLNGCFCIRSELEAVQGHAQEGNAGGKRRRETQEGNAGGMRRRGAQEGSAEGGAGGGSRRETQEGNAGEKRRRDAQEGSAGGEHRRERRRETQEGNVGEKRRRGTPEWSAGGERRRGAQEGAQEGSARVERRRGISSVARFSAGGVAVGGRRMSWEASKGVRQSGISGVAPGELLLGAAVCPGGRGVGRGLLGGCYHAKPRTPSPYTTLSSRSLVLNRI